jgi:hypothetical protein
MQCQQGGALCHYIQSVPVLMCIMILFLKIVVFDLLSVHMHLFRTTCIFHYKTLYIQLFFTCNRYPRTSDVAGLLDDLTRVTERMQPFLQQYNQLMRDDPVFEPDVCIMM